MSPRLQEPPTSPRPTAISFQQHEDAHRVVVEWLLSSVCNYSCSCCPTSLHDGRVRWPRYGDLFDFAHRVRRHYAPAATTFLLSGGEITLFPHLRTLTGELRSMGAEVAVLTNGSPTAVVVADHAGARR